MQAGVGQPASPQADYTSLFDKAKHGFDPSGAGFDENGHQKNWWEPATRKKFDERAKCFVDLYSKQWEPTVRKHVNGTLTIGENIADNGGIRAAFIAYKRHLKGKKERHVSGYSKRVLHP
ncbi:putative Neprilysin [Aphelenchoides fujianensis]|nr:putative Neprilysin [Aphelenchoides fujianensis]